MPTPQKIAEMLSTLVYLLPAPYGPVVAAALRLIETALTTGNDAAADIDALHARYSAEAQKIADAWK
jgi:hypothetical protein